MCEHNREELTQMKKNSDIYQSMRVLVCVGMCVRDSEIVCDRKGAKCNTKYKIDTVCTPHSPKLGCAYSDRLAA